MAAVAELRRFQAGCTSALCYDYAYAVAVAADSSAFFAGGTWGEWNGTTSSGMADLVVLKADSGGTLEWSWQDGSDGSDFFLAAAAVSDGGVVAAGYTNGTSWNGVLGSGELDFAAVKLSSDGSVVWTWQDGTAGEDILKACVETSDGNVVVTGYTMASWVDISNGYNNIAAAKIDVNTGTTLWEFQAGTTGSGGVYGNAAAARLDGSVVLVGLTFGEFGDTLSGSAGSSDFIAVALDEDGTELWRWQDGPGSGVNAIEGVTALDDNSVILAGFAEGDWNGEENLGGRDFAVVKLSSLGVEEWRWQGGTAENEKIFDAATGADGSVILSGYTKGSWAAPYAGGDAEGSGDVAALGLSADGTLLWTYQAGTEFDDDFNAVDVTEDGTILLAGWTNGVWGETSEFDGYPDIAAVLLDPDALLDAGSGFFTPAPGTVADTPQPIVSATPGPQESLILATPAPQESLVSATPAPQESLVSATPGPQVPPVSATPTPQDSPAPTELATEAPVSTENTGTSSTSGAPLGPIIGGAVGGAALLLLFGALLTRRHRQLRADKSFGTPIPPPVGFPQSTSTATNGNAAEAGGNAQSVVPAAGTGHAYQQSAAHAAGAGYAEPPPPSYFHFVPSAGDPAGVTLPPAPPYGGPPAYTR